MHACLHGYDCMHVLVCVYVHDCLYFCIFICMYVDVWIYIYIYMHMCMYMCIYGWFYFSQNYAFFFFSAKFQNEKCQHCTKVKRSKVYTSAFSCFQIYL